MLFCRIIILFILLAGYNPDIYPQPPGLKVPDYTGEIMKYTLKYGIFNIGSASISFLAEPVENICIIKAEAKSSRWIKIFKDLDYRFECRMDPATGLPNSAIRSLRDGRYNLYNEVIFDRCSRLDSAIVISQMSGEHIVSRDIYDILTGFYHFRKNFLKGSARSGEEVVINTFFTDELWDLRIRYAGEETIKTDYGDLECYKFSPVTVIGRFFRHEDDMVVWFTKDEISTPIRIELNLILGTIKGELSEYQRPALENSLIENRQIRF